MKILPVPLLSPNIPVPLPTGPAASAAALISWPLFNLDASSLGEGTAESALHTARVWGSTESGGGDSVSLPGKITLVAAGPILIGYCPLLPSRLLNLEGPPDWLWAQFFMSILSQDTTRLLSKSQKIALYMFLFSFTAVLGYVSTPSQVQPTPSWRVRSHRFLKGKKIYIYTHIHGVPCYFLSSCLL